MDKAESFFRRSITPTIKKLGMWSEAAETILLMIACHESMGFRHRVQQGGPALSYFQIEPDTLDDLYTNYLAFRPEKQTMLDQYLPEGMSRLEALANDDAYACAAARLQLYRVPEALPEADDLEGLARYCKTHWNTDAGKATWQKYLDDFNHNKPEGF
ncbi:MAG: hypothetical protein JKY66_00095 [Spongiibacteraceae bacterium]|nr:hypothetical protein [Spongiibacteraceae bacterium]